MTMYVDNKHFQSMVKHMTGMNRYLDLSVGDAIVKLLEEQERAKRLYCDNALQEAVRGVDVISPMADAIARLEQDRASVLSSIDLSGIETVTQIQRDLRHWHDIQLAQVAQFHEAVQSFVPELNQFNELFRPLSSFAELELPGSDVARYLGQLGLLDDFEEDGFEEGDEEGRIILPEEGWPNELRESLIEVRFLPLSLIAAIIQDPKRRLLKLSAEKFEYFIADLLHRNGARNVELSGRWNQGDHGIDVFGVFEVDGLKTLFGIQCKRYRTKKVGGADARELRGALTLHPRKPGRGVLCTTSSFQPQARGYFLQSIEIDGLDIDDLAEIIRGKRPFPVRRNNDEELVASSSN